jgi:hypothetical protein
VKVDKKYWGNFQTKLPRVNNRPKFENSQDLVTLACDGSVAKCFSVSKKAENKWFCRKLNGRLGRDQGYLLFLWYVIPKNEKNTPNNYKIYQMATKYTKLP